MPQILSITPHTTNLATGRPPSVESFTKSMVFLKKGGLEICRKGDDARWEELKRKVGSGRAFGTNVSLISASEAKEKFPLLDEDSIRGAMWDPDAGLVIPRSQDVVSFAVEKAKETGALSAYTDTPAIGFEIENGRVTGVNTDKGTIKTDKVVITSGIWGPLLGDMAGVPVPLSPVEHPLLFLVLCHTPKAPKIFLFIHCSETRVIRLTYEIPAGCMAARLSGATMRTKSPDW